MHQKNKLDTCQNLEGLLKFETSAIKKEVFGGSQLSFLYLIELMAPDMREAYCGVECKYRYDCAIAQQYIKGTSYSGRG